MFGGGALVAAGLLAAACSTDNGVTQTPTVEAGSKDGNTSKTDTGPDPETDAGPENDATTAADCAEAPRLRNNQNSFFCAFYRRDGGADSGLPQSNCENDQTCCNPGAISAGNFPPSFCADGKGEAACVTGAATSGSSWPPDGGTAWECNDKNQCQGGQICCLIPGPKKADTDIGAFPKSDPDVPPACNAKRAYNAGGSRCRAGTACNAGENRLCSVSDNNCPSGSTCTPVEGLFRDLGYCFP